MIKRPDKKKTKEEQTGEPFDRQMQKDLDRSEDEGYAVMYGSQKKKEVKLAGGRNFDKKGEEPMQVKDIMTADPAYCTMSTDLQDAARLMLECDCGELPVVDNEAALNPIGVITDRDIVCRSVAVGKNPLQMKVKDCMTQPCITVTPETSIDECCEILEDHQIRRVPVVDDEGCLCGMISQADIATHHLKDKVVEVLEEVSQPRKY